MTNRIRWVVTAVVVGVLAAPAVWPDASDGFPISNYPMFTSDRGRVMALDTAVLVVDERRERLSAELIGGTDEVVLASTIVSNAIAGGSVATDRLCREIAERVGRRGRWGDVAIVTEVHDTVALLREGSRPRSVVVHDRCPVGGGAGTR